MMRRETRTRCHWAMRRMLGALALLLVLPTAQPAAAAAPDVVRTIKVYPTPTHTMLDPQNGQVFVVSVGAMGHDGPYGWHDGLTLLDGTTGQVLHRWPGWPAVGPNPLAGHIMIQMGGHIEVLQGDQAPPTFADGAVPSAGPYVSEAFLPLALLDPPTGHILYALNYSQPELVDGFAVVDLRTKIVIHQQTLPGQQLDLIADDPGAGQFVVAGCGGPVEGSQPPSPLCTLWLVDARTGKVTDTTATAGANFISSMTIDARSGRLLLYDGLSDSYPQDLRVQIEIFSLSPLRLLHYIYLPFPFGAAAYGLLGHGAGIGVDETSGHALALSSHSLDMAGDTDTAPGTARLIDTETGKILRTLAIGAQPASAVVDSALHRAYVADAGSCDVSVIDMRAGKLVARVRTGKKFPVDELVDTKTGKVFVNNQFSGTVSMFDAATTRMDAPGC